MQGSFSQYLKANKKMLVTAGIISVTIFVIFKVLYPFPDFFVDSFNYVHWAKIGAVVQYRPTGYSTFLRFIHENISSSDTAVVTVQYLLSLFAGLYLFFSADYLFGIPQRLKWLLMLALILNPILIFQSNMVMSDSVFSSLTVIWFTLCLWAMRRQTWPYLLLQVLVLYIAFEIRYTAMFYPIIGVTVFLLFTQKPFYRLIGTMLTVVVIMTAVFQQQNAVERDTGTRVFSGFSGWQLANNVLYYRKKINVDTNAFPTDEAKMIDKFVGHYIDSVKPDPAPVGSVFMWDRNSPLKHYVYYRMKVERQPYFQQWFACSVPFNDYASHIIKNHPGAFIEYMIWPNTKNFFYPEAELLANYNISNLKFDPHTKDWFNYPTDKFECRFPDLQKYVMTPYPALSFLLNILNIVAIVVFFVRMVKKWRSTALPIKGLFFAWALFYFGYMGFSISATVVTLRYLDPLYIFGIVMPALLLTYRPGTPLPDISVRPSATAPASPETVRKQK